MANGNLRGAYNIYIEKRGESGQFKECEMLVKRGGGSFFVVTFCAH